MMTKIKLSLQTLIVIFLFNSSAIFSKDIPLINGKIAININGMVFPLIQQSLQHTYPDSQHITEIATTGARVVITSTNEIMEHTSEDNKKVAVNIALKTIAIIGIELFIKSAVMVLSPQFSELQQKHAEICNWVRGTFEATVRNTMTQAVANGIDEATYNIKKSTDPVLKRFISNIRAPFSISPGYSSN